MLNTIISCLDKFETLEEKRAYLEGVIQALDLPRLDYETSQVMYEVKKLKYDIDTIMDHSKLVNYVVDTALELAKQYKNTAHTTGIRMLIPCTPHEWKKALPEIQSKLNSGGYSILEDDPEQPYIRILANIR